MRCAEPLSAHQTDRRDASLRNGGLERVFGCGRADRAQSRTGNTTLRHDILFIHNKHNRRTTTGSHSNAERFGMCCTVTAGWTDNKHRYDQLLLHGISLLLFQHVDTRQ